MATLENRFIRIEDWKGNVYYPETNSNSSTAGEIAGGGGASTNPEDPTYTQGSKISDPDSNGGLSIALSSASVRQTLFRTYFADAKFGNVAINIRLKSSIASGNNNLVEINSYFVDASGSTPIETLLDTSYLTGKDFGVANEYVNLGTVVNYKGKATGSSMLKIELIVLPDTGCTINLDQLAISMEMASNSSNIDIYVEDHTIIVEK